MTTNRSQESREARPSDDAELNAELDAPELASPELDDEDDFDDAPLDPLDEEIAAYLDGETTPEERADFERRLAADSALRARVDDARSAWDALDALADDAKPVGAALTETTVERLNAETQTELETLERAQTRRRRRRRALNWSAAALLAIGGYCVFGAAFPDATTRGERDRLVVERLARLEIADDFAFLTALDETGLFAAPRPAFPTFPNFRRVDGGAPNAPQTAEPATNGRADSTAPQTAEPATNGEKSFKELSKSPVFYRARKKFERYDAATRDRYRAFYRRIAESPNAPRLWTTLDNYCAWFEERTTDADRDRLAALPVPERIAEIRRLATFGGGFDAGFAPTPAGAPGAPEFGSTPPDKPNGANGEPTPGAPFPPSNGSADAAQTPTPVSPTALALRGALPEELRRENLAALCRKYDDFLKAKNDDGVRRAQILAFLTETPEDELGATLSDDARAYLATLTDEERASALGLLVSLGFCESEAFRQAARFAAVQARQAPFGGGRGEERGGSRGASPRFGAERPDAPGAPGESRNRNERNDRNAPGGGSDGRDGDASEGREEREGRGGPDGRGDAPERFGPRAQFDSVRELADALRDAPPEARDAITTAPPDEMRGLLWALHWRFGRFKNVDRPPLGPAPQFPANNPARPNRSNRPARSNDLNDSRPSTLPKSEP